MNVRLLDYCNVFSIFCLNCDSILIITFGPLDSYRYIGNIVISIEDHYIGVPSHTFYCNFCRDIEYLTIILSLKSKWIVAEYSPRLKRVIVLVYTHEVISKNNLDVFKGKPMKDNFIDISIHAWKSCKWHRPCAKRVFQTIHTIFVPRDRDPFGQHQESRPLACPNTGSPRFTDSLSNLTHLIGWKL